MARTPEPDDDDVARLTNMGKALLGTLERVFPFKVRYGFLLRKIYRAIHVVQREGALDPARSKDSPTYGQVLPYLLILAHTA